MNCRTCNEVGRAVTCVVCGLRKKPRGRSAPLEMANSLCDHECPGYDHPPEPRGLWPGERHGDSFGHAEWHQENA